MTSTQVQARRALAEVMATAEAMGRITPSRLMSPQEIEVATRGNRDLEGRMHGWCLCTELPDAMWQAALDARSRDVPYQTLVVTGPSGLRYLVIVVNADGWQHRVCIPLFGDATAEWLGSLASERVMKMSIAEAGSKRTFITESVVPLEAIGELAGIDHRPPSDLLAFLEEAFRLLVWNAMCATTKPVGGMKLPSEVSLSLLLPAEFEAQIELRAGEWADRKLS